MQLRRPRLALTPRSPVVLPNPRVGLAVTLCPNSVSLQTRQVRRRERPGQFFMGSFEATRGQRFPGTYLNTKVSAVSIEMQRNEGILFAYLTVGYTLCKSPLQRALRQIRISDYESQQ